MLGDIKNKNEESTSSDTGFEKPDHKKGGFLRIIIIILILAIVVLAILYAISQYTKWDVLGVKKGPTNTATPGFFGPTGDWQAVFLTNGQVYFGRLKNVTSDYPELSDIYYLQVQQVPIQPAAQPASPEKGVQPAQQTQQQLIMIKFGTELHRPADKMFINKDHVMFYEDLTIDSPVVKSIEEYKAKQAGTK